MSGDFASGRNSHGFCDRCNFRYQLKALRKLTINETQTNIKVCPTCWEPDQPQYRVGRVDTKDPQALRDPRPDPSLANSR